MTSCHHAVFPRMELTGLLCLLSRGSADTQVPIWPHLMWLWCWAGDTAPHPTCCLTPHLTARVSLGSDAPELTALVAHLSSSANWQWSGSPQGQSQPLTWASVPGHSEEVSWWERGRKWPFTCTSSADSLDAVAPSAACSHSRLQTGSFTQAVSGNRMVGCQAVVPLFHLKCFLELLPLRRWLPPLTFGMRHEHH